MKNDNQVKSNDGYDKTMIYWRQLFQVFIFSFAIWRQPRRYI